MRQRSNFNPSCTGVPGYRMPFPGNASMALDPDDVGDAQSRADARNYPETFERSNLGTGRPAPRRIPTGSRRMSLGDFIAIMLGIAFLLVVWSAHLLGYY